MRSPRSVAPGPNRLEDVIYGTKGFDIHFGFGQVDALKAVAAAEKTLRTTRIVDVEADR